MPPVTIPHPKDVDPRRLTDVLNEIMHAHGLNQYDLAEHLDVSQPSVSAYLRGDSKPRRATLQRLIESFKVNPDFLTGADDTPLATSPSSGNAAPLPSTEAPFPGAVAIPRNGYASAGPGSTGDAAAPADPAMEGARTTPVDYYPYVELLRLTGRNPEDLRSAFVIGDSNLPEIPPNTQVLYFPCDRFLDDGLYVLDVDDLRKVKALQLLGGGVLEIIPYNERYHRERFVPIPYPDEADTPNTYRSELTGATSILTPVGKVVYYGKPA